MLNLNLELIIPSIYAFYEHLNDGYFITQQIVESVQLFKDPKINNYYLDNITRNLTDYSEKFVFFDNNYWNFWYTNSTYLINNHFVWNYLNSPTKMLISEHLFWINLYPINLHEYNWSVSDKTFFKVILSNNYKEIYDIQFVSKRQLKHHDYTNDIYVCSNLFWQQYLNTNTTLWGFNLFWYENYGAVEIGLKSLFTYWYQLIYPSLESELTLFPFSSFNSFNTIYSDSNYFNGIPNMILDYNKSSIYTE